LYVLAAALPLIGGASAILKSTRGLREYDAEERKVLDWIAEYETPLSDALRNHAPEEVVAELQRKRDSAPPQPPRPKDGMSFRPRRDLLAAKAQHVWGEFTVAGIGLLAGAAASIWSTLASVPHQ
jgi:hypothetical protein